MLGDYETAEDVTHEAFVALIEHPERYKPERGHQPTGRSCLGRIQLMDVV
jgi:DNA-directed RNA polymerase specialized sigma24 family protein